MTRCMLCQVLFFLLAFITYSFLSISTSHTCLFMTIIMLFPLLILLPPISGFLLLLNVSLLWLTLRTLLFNSYHWWYLSWLGSHAWVKATDYLSIIWEIRECTVLHTQLLITFWNCLGNIWVHQWSHCSISCVQTQFSMGLFTLLCSLLWPPAPGPLSMVGQVVHCSRAHGQGIPDNAPLTEWGAAAQGCVYLAGQADGRRACSSPDSEYWIYTLNLYQYFIYFEY